MRNDFFEFKWRDQPGNLEALKIKEGFAQFLKISKNHELSEKEQLDKIKTIAESLLSYHAACTYVQKILLQQNESPKSFKQILDETVSWYLRVALIHGAPAFYFLASTYLKFAEIETDLKQKKSLLMDCYTYIEVGLRLKEMSRDAIYNAYAGNLNPIFYHGSPEKLKIICGQYLNKIKATPDEKCQETFIKQHIDRIHNYRRNQLKTLEL